MNFHEEAVVSAYLGEETEWYGLFKIKLRTTGYIVYGTLVNGQQLILERLPGADLQTAKRALIDWSDIYGLRDTEAV